MSSQNSPQSEVSYKDTRADRTRVRQRCGMSLVMLFPNRNRICARWHPPSTIQQYRHHGVTYAKNAGPPDRFNKLQENEKKFIVSWLDFVKNLPATSTVSGGCDDNLASRSRRTSRSPARVPHVSASGEALVSPHRLISRFSQTQRRHYKLRVSHHRLARRFLLS